MIGCKAALIKSQIFLYVVCLFNLLSKNKTDFHLGGEN